MQKESLLASMPKLILIMVIIISLGTVLGIIEYFNFKYPSNKISSIFTICPNTVKDIDNNVYETIKIGNQCWMKENLKVTKNPQGKVITRYCYDNDSNICNTDGGLYDWNTTMNGLTEEGVQGICPDGWHIPRASEWQALKKILPTKIISETVFTHCFSLNCAPEEEKQIKSIEIVDYSSFNLSFSGARFDNYYSNKIQSSFFWSSTERGRQAWSMRIDKTFYQNTYLKSVYNKINGFSIRCLKD